MSNDSSVPEANPSPVRVTAEEQAQTLRRIGDLAQAFFAETHGAREQAFALSREVVRNSANSIRATHRGEFTLARQLLDVVAQLNSQIERLLESEPAVYYAGFVEDAQKEYVEAMAVLAFAEGAPLTGPEEMKIGPAPYLNGLAEAASELRRFILDSLRRDDFSRCEELLDIMDEVYSILVVMDFPDAVTRGLRRTTDAVRAVIERTRGDLTVALRQRRLEQKLASLEGKLGRD